MSDHSAIEWTDGQRVDLNAHPGGWPGWQAARERGWQMFHAAGKHAAGRELDGRTWDEFPGQETTA